MSEALAAPAENISRGITFALLVVPAGIAAWLVLWSFGFIASLVAWGIVWAAVQLYVRGSGGRLSRPGAFAILTIVVVTLLLAFFSGMVYDAAHDLGKISSLTTWEAFTHPQFWPTFWDFFPNALPDYLPNFAMAVAFGALGSFRTLRGVFQHTATAPSPGPSGPEHSPDHS
ncbi:MAG: putative rane protein [Aeromicrobium sp.]|nr:putative rane protein [Aeromicrobium sp.]